MKLVQKLKNIPRKQLYRYLFIIVSCLLFFSPFLLLPRMVGNDDMCGVMCMRRFFLYFPGMSFDDFRHSISVAWVGVILISSIFITTFFYGRIWCGYICPVGGLPELVSRSLDDKWKIEYRSLPQVPIRYGYFAVYVLLMPALGISACTLCNFITLPRIFESLSGGMRGLAFILSTVGLVNLALLFLMGFFASKGRAYCQFLCPIGAMDGLINRLGASLRFTRRIRVERERCTGCNICARNCMTGAIKMVDRVAVVDQLSCMSCHECVDVCDWHAIDWLAIPPDNQARRQKKGVDFYPLPKWEAVHIEKPQQTEKSEARSFQFINWQRVLISVILGLAITLIVIGQVEAKQRLSDPDGCFSCHALQGLEYIDDKGVRRNASIDLKHYTSSLHGSIACSDCHRKIQRYPHKPENGEVDCAASCHLEEPSKEEFYSHKKISQVFEKSAHGEGKTHGFTGGNRLAEAEQQNPSCRLCHQNTLYIDPSRLSAFKKAFSHTKTECGSCHKGETWLNHFGGHILRRFMSGKKSKQDENKICNKCHANRERMKNVKIKDKQTNKSHKASEHFILASDSYAMTLHGRLLAANNQHGVSCNDCHTPGKEKHAIMRHTESSSPTHKNNLAKTCAAANCHEYSDSPLNKGFINTDMHNLDQVPLYKRDIEAFIKPDSPWKIVLILMAPLVIALLVGSVLWNIKGKKGKSIIFALFGGDRFQKIILGRRPKSNKKAENKKADKK